MKILGGNKVTAVITQLPHELFNRIRRTYNAETMDYTAAGWVKEVVAGAIYRVDYARREGRDGYYVEYVNEHGLSDADMVCIETAMVKAGYTGQEVWR